MEAEPELLPDDEAHELARVVVHSTLGHRSLLRESVRLGLGKGAPASKNGHHVGGLYAPEPDEVDRALEKDIDPKALLEKLDVVTPTPDLGASERALFFRSMFREEKLSLEDNTPFRVRAAWRIVREMARLCGLITDEDKLEYMEAVSPCPWSVSTSCGLPSVNEKRGHLARVWPLVKTLTKNGGMPLLPPPVPSRYIDKHGVKSSYDPTQQGQDPPLRTYLAVISSIAKYLGIADGTVEQPRAGKLGMQGLEDPELVRLAFPSRFQIMACEDVVVMEALDLLVQNGAHNARKKLKLKYGLTAREAKSVIRMAMIEGRDRLSQTGTDEERSLMVLRLEAYIHRCSKYKDLRSELGALKQLTVLLGLNKADPDDIMKEFVDIVATVAAKSTKDRRIVMDVMKVPALITDGVEGD